MGLPCVTKNKYKTWEVVSALQKEIRRGNEKEALYWCLELADSGMIDLAAGRLRVIALEDIGNTDMVPILYAFLCIDQAQKWFKGKNDAWMLGLGNAVMALARARKTRIGDSFHAAVLKMRDERHLEIPEYALDMHTARGREMGRGLDHFMEHCAQLSNDASEEMPDIYFDEAMAYWRRHYEHPETKPEVNEPLQPSLL